MTRASFHLAPLLALVVTLLVAVGAAPSALASPPKAPPTRTATQKRAAPKQAVKARKAQKKRAPVNHFSTEKVVNFIKRELSTHKLRNRVERSLDWSAGRSFAKTGRPLASLVPAGGSAALVTARAILGKVQKRPAQSWHQAIRKEATGHPDPKVRAVFEKVSRRMLKRAGRLSYETQEARILTRYAQLLVGTGRLAGKDLLPPVAKLPTTKGNTVAKASLKAFRESGEPQDAKSAYRWLEAERARLRGSDAKTDHAKADELGRYLETTRPWAKDWLTERLTMFEASSPVAADFLEGRVRFEAAADHGKEPYPKDGPKPAEVHAAQKAKIAEASRILRAMVHPDILARMPPVEFVVVMSPKYRASYNGGGGKKPPTIKIGGASELRSILHEYGHHIAQYGGFHARAAEHAILNVRAFSGRQAALPKRGEKEQGFAGGFERDYMGRVYSGGSTEILSMGVERLQSLERASTFLAKDGDYLLRVLDVIQKPPPKVPGNN